MSKSTVDWLHDFGNLEEPAFSLAEEISELVISIEENFDEPSAELSAGFRKLLEARDCFVRALSPSNQS